MIIPTPQAFAFVPRFMFTENDVTFLSALYFVGKSVDIFVACDDWWCTFDANDFFYMFCCTPR
jgi:hypothetical protein